MAALHHLGYLIFSKFQLLVRFGGPVCVIVPNFVRIGQTVTEIWRFFDFSGWRPPPSWIF